jgi:acyl-CoA synthetase (AMP-forming)/AMP-acid ligase II
VQLPVLIERHERADLAALDAAWSDDETFAFIPGKSGVAAEWIASSMEALPQDLQYGHFALLTSGSTGKPKLVIGEKRRAEALARALHVAQESDPVRETILALPLTYCYAFVNQWLWGRVMNRRLVHTRGFAHADELRVALRSAQDAMICLVRIQLPLFRQVFGDEAFAGVVRVHFAGGAFPQSQLDEVKRIFVNAVIFNNYGCAEAMPRLTLRRAEEAKEASDIGAPLDGVELRTSPEGEVQFRSRFGAVAFVDESGFHRIGDGEWTTTGDRGAAGEGGRWHLGGRMSEVFKRYGEKISLPLLAEAVQRAWRGAAAFYRERDPAGEEGHVLVIAPQPQEDEVHAILQAFRSGYARAHWPLRIESVPLLPTLPNGKIDTAALSSLAGKSVAWRQRIR